jgi:hypothetical protein
VRLRYARPILPVNNQHYPNVSNVLLDIYRLLTIFMAAETISELEVPQSYGNDPLQQFDDFQSDEITRILLTVAVTVRVIDDREARLFDFLSLDCGSLTPDVENPGKAIALTIHEACNKILHARQIDFDRIPAVNGRSFLQSKIRLTGDYRGRAWHASLDVVRFCRECAAILRLLMPKT